MNKAELFFEAGVDGGGEALYRRPDGTFFTVGSSGGMLDIEEDPIISWKEEYPDFQNYWDNFVRKNENFWPCFFPLFIHSDAFPVIQKAIDGFFDGENEAIEVRSDFNYHFDKWIRAMDRKH